MERDVDDTGPESFLREQKQTNKILIQEMSFFSFIFLPFLVGLSEVRFIKEGVLIGYTSGENPPGKISMGLMLRDRRKKAL